MIFIEATSIPTNAPAEKEEACLRTMRITIMASIHSRDLGNPRMTVRLEKIQDEYDVATHFINGLLFTLRERLSE